MASVRITNLSDDATENDLQELFRSFGRIARISVPRDRNTKQVGASQSMSCVPSVKRVAWARYCRPDRRDTYVSCG